MAVQDKRYESTKQLDRIVAACEMTNVVYAQDDKGHYIESYVAPDWFNNMPDVTTHAPKPVVVAKPMAVKRGSGTCEAIRSWVQANPQATKKDAMAHFSHLNPSTVGVQFGKAKYWSIYAI